MSLLSVLTGQEAFSPSYDLKPKGKPDLAEKQAEQKKRAREATAEKQRDAEIECREAFGPYLRTAADIASLLGIYESTAHSKLYALAERGKVEMVGKYKSAGSKKYIFMWKWIGD